MTDREYMQRALELALKAEGDTSPNPLVGCVLTDEAGRIIGEGYHHKAGEPHAEVMALRDAAARGETANLHTAYVTLEPCSHFGRVGPCADALVAAGVKRVVAAMGDPNPKVAGKGFAKLRENGIAVEVGLCSEEAEYLNRKFLSWITSGKPFVTLKYAMTLDGKIATVSGDSKWITGEKARSYAHFLRKTHDAILVGINTIIKDDSELTTRLVEGKNPVRIVLDSRGRLSVGAKVLNNEARTVIVTGEKISLPAEITRLPNVEQWEIPLEDGKIPLEKLLERLSEEKLTSLLVEGGAAVLGEFFRQGLYNEVYSFIAPRIFGADGLSPFTGEGNGLLMSGAGQLKIHEILELGEDICLVTERKA